MSLRTRTLLTIGLVTAALTAILGLLFSQTLLRAFAEAEVRDTERDVHHARMFLTDELRAMDVLNHDWASWDDTYAFIEDANPAYIRANLTDATFQNTHLNLMLFVHTSGRVVWAGAYDLEANREAPVPQGVYDALGLLARPPEEGTRGLLLLPEGVLLVTARPILTSEDQGPARGAVVFGRYLNSGLLARMSAHLDLSVTAHRADRPQDWPDDLRAAYPSLSPEAPVLARPLDDARIAGYGLMTDLYGRPALILRTEGPRDIVARGRMALQYLVVTTAALGLLVTLAAVLQIDRSVLARLAALRADVRAVGAGGEPRRRVAVTGRDELADLARAFNETLDALEAARREREEQEAQLRRLAENSPDVIYRLILSPFRPLYVSPAVTSLLGYPPEEFYKDRDLPYRLIHPDDHALLQAALRLDIPPEQPLVLRWVSRSGQVVWAEHRHFVVYDEAGRAVAVEGIARDITAQKQAEEELAHLNAVLRAIRNINQAIARERDRERLLQQACEELVTRGYTGAWCVVTDEAGRAVRGSAAGCVQEGFPALLQAWTAGTPPDCARQALAVPDPVITPDPMACTACPLRFPYRGAAALTVRMAYGGQVYGVLSVALPAGIPPSAEEQRLLAEVASDLAFALHSLEQEEALRESEERFRLLAEHALTGIYLIQDGLLRYVNPAGARMFGYEPEELIDRLGPLDVVAPEDREQVAENIRKRLTGEALSVRYTVQGLRKDGSRFPCEVLGTRVEYRGRPAILGTVLDLTDRVRAEEAVRRQAAQTEALRQIGLELFAQTDLNVLLPSIVRRALDLVGGSAGGLYLYRPEADVLEWVVSVGPDQPPLGTCLRPSEGGIACRVWETGRPFWVDDYSHWEGRAARYADYPWTAVIGVPVRRGEEMLGVLVLLADPPRTFSQADADVLELFAAQTAVALTNARLYDEVRREREHLDFLHQLGQRLSATLDVRAVAREALETLRAMTEADQGVICLAEPGTSRLRIIAATGHDEASVEELDRRLQPRVGQGLTGWVALHRQAAVVDDVSRDDRWLVVRGLDEEVRSAVSVPLLFGEELVGVMSLGSLREAAFTPDHVRLLEAAGAVLAGALLNARLYEAEQERARRIAAVAELGEHLAALLEPEKVYPEAVEGIVRAFGYDYAGLMLLDEGAGELEFVAGAGIWAGLTPPGFRQRVGEGMIGWVARTGQTLLANDVSQEPRYIAPYLTETQAELDVPLKYHGHLIGVLTLQSRQRDAFTPLDVATLEALAGHIAAAVQNARLYQQERAARQRLEALYRIGQAVNSTLDPALILDQLTGEAMRATGATHGSVLVPDPEWGVFERRSLRGYSPEERSRAIAQPLSLDRGINGRAYRLRQGVYVPDVRQDPNYFPLIPTARSELVLPLMRGDRILGLLDLQSPQVDAFRDVDMGFLRALADQVAVALENARLYQEERRRSQEQEILALIATALNTLQVRRAFPILVRGLQELTGCDRVAVALLEDDRAHYRISVLETPYPVLTEGTVLPLSTTPVWDDLLGGQPHFCPDMGAEVEYETIRALYDAGFRSYVSLPLWAGGRVIGALHLVSLREQNFRREQVPVLQRVADALAAAIENERLYRAEREHRELAQALAESAAVITRTLDPTQMLEQIIEQVARVVPGDAFNIMLLENDTARIVRWRGYERFGAEEWVAAAVLPVADLPNLWEMVRTGEPVLVPDTHADPHWARIRGLEWVRSYVAAPIVIRGITVGFLNVDGTRPHQFGSADAARLKAFADQVAIALENARLYTELRHYAGTLEEQVRERTAQLAAQYARLEAILRSTGDGILLTDARGEILQANPVAQRWLARDLAPEDARKLQEAIRRVARRAQERPEEIVELPGLDLEVRASPVEGPAGEEAAVVILHDVTQFKTLERLRVRFISNISHELRTPLTTIKTYLHLLRQTPELLPEYLDILEREADWQARLVEDVLEISRLDSGALRMHFSPVGLNALAAEVVDAQRPLALAQGLVLEFRPAEAGPVAWADPDALRMVLINLIRNSIQYTPSDGRVEVATGEAEREGHRWATVTVADTGIGIPKDELPYIFDRFFRGERPRQMQIPGTGLGLSIVKEIVDRHGGRVSVESEVGKGTRFTVWLPVAEERPPTTDD
jgi:PAS domain S-box-containing protein